MLTISDEQRRVFKDEGVPIPLIDLEAEKYYMVMPIEFSAVDGVIRARIPGYDAIAEADVQSDAALTLALLLRTVLE